ncbi:MAG: hypothetical protein K2L88_04095, partial [Clostridiales bacterium]|nr:hypothetical protein [Clostridiales bacterium]
MEKINANRTVLWKIVALVLAMCICLCAFCAATIGFADESGSDTPVADQRISLSDLMSRHGVDYAIGPTVTEFEKDNLKYNNNYGITSDKYFSYENYLFIDTVDGKKTLHGWKNGILPAEPTGKRIRVDGTDGAGQVYIYAEKKYVIVLPDDVEVIGTSNYYFDRYFNRTG